MEDEIVTQMGLLLTQMRGVRGSLDQIAQATSRYAGFAFAEAFTPGGRFGAPPMRDGALLVHVVNLRDLVASSGIAGFFEGLLGGIGRFFGGLVGGIIGGTIAGVALPVMIWKVDSIVTTLRQILDRLGISTAPSAAPATPAAATAAAAPEPPSSAAGGPSLLEQIGELRDIISLITGLFEAAGSGGGEVGPQRRELAVTPQTQAWMAALDSVRGVLDGVTRIIKGLVILVPILVGSLALLIDKLDAIKLAFVELLSFLVRNVMLLRGVILVTVFDLLAVTSRLIAGLVQTIGQMVEGMLRAVFDLAGTVLQGALAVFQFLATGLQRTVNGMLRWLVDTLFVVLARFGDLRIFRLVTHLVQVMPAVLPPLYELLRDDSSPQLTPAQQQALTDAAALALPGPAVSSRTLPSSTLPAMPNVADLAMPTAAVDALRNQMNSLRDGLLAGVGSLTGVMAGGFRDLAARFDAMARGELERSQTDYAVRLNTVRANAATFAAAFGEAERAVRERPASGLEAIAQAYERWLTSDGLTTVLSEITRFFQETPPANPDSAAAAVVGEPLARPRASIEIDEVVIELMPGETAPDAELLWDGIWRRPDVLFAQLQDYVREQRLRGGDADLLSV